MVNRLLTVVKRHLQRQNSTLICFNCIFMGILGHCFLTSANSGGAQAPPPPPCPSPRYGPEFQTVQTTKRWFKCPLQNTQTIEKWHSQSTNCSTFYTGIGKCKTKRSSQNTNRQAIHIEVGHEIVKQSSQSVNSSPFICTVEQSKRELTSSQCSNNTL